MINVFKELYKVQCFINSSNISYLFAVIKCLPRKEDFIWCTIPGYVALWQDVMAAGALKTQKAANACTQLALYCVFSDVPQPVEWYPPHSVGIPFSVNLHRRA